MKSTDKRKACRASAEDDEILFLDGFDEAIVGWTERDGTPVAAYCAKRMVRALIREGWRKADAWEHLGNNVACAWIGPKTPVIVFETRERGV